MCETERFKVGDNVLYKNQLCTIKMIAFYYSAPVYFIEFNDKSIIASLENELEEYKPKTNNNMENKEFTIDDLKSGMIVETRSEEKYLVIKDCEFYGGDKGIAFVNATGFNKSNSYNKDLTCKKMKSYDIMKVYYDGCINGETHSMKYQPLIWQRKEKQQFTKEQIAERLGLSIDEFDIK